MSLANLSPILALRCTDTLVTPYNIVYLQTLVNNGPSTYPGARYYVKDTGERVDLKYRKSGEPISLQFGWIVERHLKDGEWVIISRF